MKVYIVKAIAHIADPVSKTWNVRAFLDAKLAKDYVEHLQCLADNYHEMYLMDRAIGYPQKRLGEGYNPHYATVISMDELMLCEATINGLRL